MRAGWFKAGAWVLFAIMVGGSVCAHASPQGTQRDANGRRDGQALRAARTREVHDARGFRGGNAERASHYRMEQERAPRGYGAMVPEGADARLMQRQVPDPLSRDDSIRDDITRYNEERRAAAHLFPGGGEMPARQFPAPAPFPQN
jgi:hypothetical protein